MQDIQISKDLSLTCYGDGSYSMESWDKNEIYFEGEEALRLALEILKNHDDVRATIWSIEPELSSRLVLSHMSPDVNLDSLMAGGLVVLAKKANP